MTARDRKTAKETRSLSDAFGAAVNAEDAARSASSPAKVARPPVPEPLVPEPPLSPVLITKPAKSTLVTLRLTTGERERLEELAVGMTLSAYIRACVFAEEERRRKRRPRSVVADRQAAAEALALLGQSRIASNLNQLAYHANIGALLVEDRERAQIDEAYGHVLSIRALLMTALGVGESR